MPQISLYIDEATLKKVEGAASREHVSISKWVGDQIRSKVQPNYPKGFEELFGSLSDSSLERPLQPNFTADSKREEF